MSKDKKCGHHGYYASKEEQTQLPLIGDKAPSFKAETTMGKVKFPNDYKGKWVILFSHPGDFTPVCTTEFINFARMHEQFREINTELIGLSIDSTPSHIAWAESIENIDWEGEKGTKIDFPIINDLSMEVSRKYGMVHDKGGTQTVRAVFIIDDKGKVRLIMYYPAAVGRNMDEIYRAVVALQKADLAGVATPANWRPGDKVIDPIPSGHEAIKERLEIAEENGLDVKDWYLVLKDDKEEKEED